MLGMFLDRGWVVQKIEWLVLRLAVWRLTLIVLLRFSSSWCSGS
jgi:hypothetical protein